jgi:hypothetical protein
MKSIKKLIGFILGLPGLIILASRLIADKASGNDSPIGIALGIPLWVGVLLVVISFVLV